MMNIKQLDVLCAEALPFFTTRIPTIINEGGCGVFARILCSQLDKYDIPYKIYGIFRNPDEDDAYKELMNLVKGEHFNVEAGVEHILVLVQDTFYVDSTGICNVAFWHAKTQVELTMEQLNKLIDECKWNPVFDRECIPQMERDMEEIFSHLNEFEFGEFRITSDSIRVTDSTAKARAAEHSDDFMRMLMEASE